MKWLYSFIYHNNKPRGGRGSFLSADRDFLPGRMAFLWKWNWHHNIWSPPFSVINEFRRLKIGISLGPSFLFHFMKSLNLKINKCLSWWLCWVYNLRKWSGQIAYYYHVAVFIFCQSWISKLLFARFGKALHDQI